MRRFALGWLLAASLALPAAAQRPELLAPDQLRVCADPNDLPFSNQAQEGFENKIAAIIGADLHVPVSFVWFPQTVGFIRNTLQAMTCDLVIGTVAGDGMMDTTTPYYHPAYMMVTRQADHIDADSVGDPALANKQFGIVAATPPTNLLLAHHLLGQTHSYALVADTRFNNPAQQMLQDLADHKIDVALVWGPIAAWAITHDHLPLKAVFLKSEPGQPRLDYRIAMGVRPGEPEWRRRINLAIGRHRKEIDAVLAQYGIKSVDAPP